MSLSKMRKRLPVFIGNLLLILGLTFVFLSFLPLITGEIWYFFKNVKQQEYALSRNNPDAGSYSVFEALLTSRPILITPVNQDFALVIEKLGINVPVVPDVSVTDETAYIEALKSGVAHAAVSPYPSEDAGNTYIFAHASLNFWKLGKYATVFNLLRKLELGDRIYVFYDGKAYEYETVNKEVVNGWNTYPLTRPTIEPILTLQTCDPPGTTINRLIITAKLVQVSE